MDIPDLSLLHSLSIITGTMQRPRRVRLCDVADLENLFIGTETPEDVLIAREEMDDESE